MSRIIHNLFEKRTRRVDPEIHVPQETPYHRRAQPTLTYDPFPSHPSATSAQSMNQPRRTPAPPSPQSSNNSYTQGTHASHSASLHTPDYPPSAQLIRIAGAERANLPFFTPIGSAVLHRPNPRRHDGSQPAQQNSSTHSPIKPISRTHIPASSPIEALTRQPYAKQSQIQSKSNLHQGVVQGEELRPDARSAPSQMYGFRVERKAELGQGFQRAYPVMEEVEIKPDVGGAGRRNEYLEKEGILQGQREIRPKDQSGENVRSVLSSTLPRSALSSSKKEYQQPSDTRPTISNLGNKKKMKVNSGPRGSMVRIERKEVETRRKKSRMRRKLTPRELMFRDDEDESTHRAAEDTDEEEKWAKEDEENQRRENEDELDDTDDRPGGYFALSDLARLKLDEEKDAKAIKDKKRKEAADRRAVIKAAAELETARVEAANQVNSDVPVVYGPMVDPSPAKRKTFAQDGWVTDNMIKEAAFKAKKVSPTPQYPKRPDNSDDEEVTEEYIRQCREVYLARVEAGEARTPTPEPVKVVKQPRKKRSPNGHKSENIDVVRTGDPSDSNKMEVVDTVTSDLKKSKTLMKIKDDTKIKKYDVSQHVNAFASSSKMIDLPRAHAVPELIFNRDSDVMYEFEDSDMDWDAAIADGCL